MDIEILEEYEDLIMPAMQSDTEKGGGGRGGVENNRHGGGMVNAPAGGDNISESSESVDMDIFDESSDEETNAATERALENVMQKRHQASDDDSEDSLEQLVRELAHKRQDESASTNSLTSCLKKNSNCDNLNSSGSSLQKQVAFAPLPPVEKITRTNISVQQPLESFGSISTAAPRKSTIVKPEKLQFKDPTYDPLSLEQSDVVNALSDISNDSFVSATEAEAINVAGELSSSYGSLNSTTKSSTISTFISTADLPEKPQVISDSILVPADTTLIESLKNHTLELESNKLTTSEAIDNFNQENQQQTKPEEINNDIDNTCNSETKNAAEQQIHSLSSEFMEDLFKDIETSNEITITTTPTTTETTQTMEQTEVVVESKVTPTVEPNSCSSTLNQQDTEFDKSEELTKVATESELKTTKVPNIQSKNAKNEKNSISKAKQEQEKERESNKNEKSDKTEIVVTEKQTTEKIEVDENNKTLMPQTKIEKAIEEPSTTTTTKTKTTTTSIEIIKETTNKEKIVENKADSFTATTSKKDEKVKEELLKHSNVSKEKQPTEEKVTPQQNKGQTNIQKTENKSSSKPNTNSKTNQKSNVKSTNIDPQSHNTTKTHQVVAKKPLSKEEEKEGEKQGKDSEITIKANVVESIETNTKPKDSRKSIEPKKDHKRSNSSSSGSKIVEKTSLITKPKPQQQQQSSNDKSSSSSNSSKEKNANLSKSLQHHSQHDATPKRINVPPVNVKKSQEETTTPNVKQEQQAQRKHASTTALDTSKNLEKTPISLSLKHQPDKRRDSGMVSSSSTKLERSASSTNIKQTQSESAIKKSKTVLVAPSTKKFEKTASTPDKESLKIKSTDKTTTTDTSLNTETVQQTSKGKPIDDDAKKLQKTATSSSLKSELEKEPTSSSKKLQKTSSSSSLKSELEKEPTSSSKKLQKTPSSSNLKDEGNKVAENNQNKSGTTKLEQKTASSSSLKSDSDKESKKSKEHKIESKKHHHHHSNKESSKDARKLERTVSSSSLKSGESSDKDKETSKRKDNNNAESHTKLQKTPSTSSLSGKSSTSKETTPKTKHAVETKSTNKVERSSLTSSIKSEEANKNVGDNVGSTKNLQKSASTSSLKKDKEVPLKVQDTVEKKEEEQTLHNTPKTMHADKPTTNTLIQKPENQQQQQQQKETPKTKAEVKSFKSLIDKKESKTQQRKSEKVSIESKQNEAVNKAQSKDNQKSVEATNKVKPTTTTATTTTSIKETTDTKPTAKNETLNQTVKSELSSTTSSLANEKCKEATLEKSNEQKTLKSKKPQQQERPTTTNEMMAPKSKEVDKAKITTVVESTTKAELPKNQNDGNQKTNEKASQPRITIKRTQFDKSKEATEKKLQKMPTTTEPVAKAVEKQANVEAKDNKTTAKEDNKLSKESPKVVPKKANEAVAGAAGEAEISKEPKTKPVRDLDKPIDTAQPEKTSVEAHKNIKDERKTVESQPQQEMELSEIAEGTSQTSSIVETTTTTLLKKLPKERSLQSPNNAATGTATIDEKRQLRKRGLEESPEPNRKSAKSNAPKNVVPTAQTVVELKGNADSQTAAAEIIHTPAKKLKVETPSRKSRRHNEEVEELVVSSCSTQEQKNQTLTKVLTTKTNVKSSNEVSNKNVTSTTTTSTSTPKQVPKVATTTTTKTLPKDIPQKVKPLVSSTSTTSKSASTKIDLQIETKEKEEQKDVCKTTSTSLQPTTSNTATKITTLAEKSSNVKKNEDHKNIKEKPISLPAKVLEKTSPLKEPKASHVKLSITPTTPSKTTTTMPTATTAAKTTTTTATKAATTTITTATKAATTTITTATKAATTTITTAAKAATTTITTATKAATTTTTTPNVMTFNEWLARKSSKNEKTTTSQNKSDKEQPQQQPQQQKQQQQQTENAQTKSTTTTAAATKPEEVTEENTSQSKKAKKSEIEILQNSLGKEIREALSTATASEDETSEAVQTKLRSSPRKFEIRIATESKTEKDKPQQQQQQPQQTTATKARTTTRRSEIDVLKELTRPAENSLKATNTKTITKTKTLSQEPSKVFAEAEIPKETEKNAADICLEPALAQATTKSTENVEKSTALTPQSGEKSEKPAVVAAVNEEVALEKSSESEVGIKEAAPRSTKTNDSVTLSSTPSVEIAASEVVKTRPRNELNILRDALPKDMRESGIDDLIRAHAESPHCLTKRSAATALGGAVTTKRTRRSANAVSDTTRPSKRVLTAAEVGNSTAAGVVSTNKKSNVQSPGKNANTNKKNARNPDKQVKILPAYQFKCRKLCVRINRAQVRRYLESQREKKNALIGDLVPVGTPTLQKISARKRKALEELLGDAKRIKETTTTTTTAGNRGVTASPQTSPQRHARTIQPKLVPIFTTQTRRSKGGQNKVTPTTTITTATTIKTGAHKHTSISPTPMQSAEDLLLTPISVAPILSTTPTVTTQGKRGRSKRKGKNTTVTSSLPNTIPSTTTVKPVAVSAAAAAAALPPPPAPSAPVLPTSTAAYSNRSTTLQPTVPTLTEAIIAPKREIDDDEYNNSRLTSTAAAETYTPPVELNTSNLSTSLSSGIPRVISGATSHSLPPGFIDNAGTRLYSYLHPTRYNSNHGNVMLDYCCPNLDGPMTAIDPTRRHDKIDAVVRELPAYISMETRLVTRAELEANSNSIPAAIRHKVQRMTSAKTSAPAPAPAPNNEQTAKSTSIPITPVDISALQKQLPATTTLTAKTGPNQRSSVRAGGAGGDASTTTTTTTTSSTTASIPSAIIKPTTLEEMRAKNRISLKNFDILIKRHYQRIAMLTFAERQRLQESMVNATQLMSRDIDMASRVFQEYVTHMALITARALSPPPQQQQQQQQQQSQQSMHVTPIDTTTATTTAAINALSTTSPTTRAQAKKATKKSGTAPKMVRKTVPIYGSNNSIIGYQVQMVSNGGGLGAKTASLPSLTMATTQSFQNSTKNNTSFSTPIATTSATSAATGRRAGVFLIDPHAAKTVASNSLQASPILANMLNSSTTITPTTSNQSNIATNHRALLHSSTPNTSTAAGSVVTRSGRGVNVKQHLSRTTTNPRIQATPPLSTSLSIASTTPTLSASLPCLPTLTRNPHLPPISEPLSLNQTATVTPRISSYAVGVNASTVANLQGTKQTTTRLTRTKTNANSKNNISAGPSTNSRQLIIVNHDLSGNPLPIAEESILPDECADSGSSTAAAASAAAAAAGVIKSEAIDY